MEGDERGIATIAGVAIGVIVRGELGRSLDQSCVGQALEYGRTGRPVDWRDPGTGANARVTPMDPSTGRDGR